MPLIEKTTKIPSKNSLWPQNKPAKDNTTTILITIDEKTTQLRIVVCLSIITNAFDRENHQDSIKELIVASKQISKRQHNNNSYYY